MKKNRPALPGATTSLDRLLDVPLRLTVELGRTRMRIDELLRLSNGSVVELNRLAGEPLEIFVGGKLIARGEAVVVNDHLGVRITEVVADDGTTQNPFEESA